MKRAIELALIAVAAVWAVHVINLIIPVDLRQYGIRPRSLSGLWGIVFSPFLHRGWFHLIANTGALFVLLTVAFALSLRLAARALGVIVIVGGGLVWLVGGSNTVHIGASGVIFGLVGYLMASGIFRRDVKSLIVSIVVLIAYGGLLFSLIGYTPGVSWIGHAGGFLSGILAAWVVRTGSLK